MTDVTRLLPDGVYLHLDENEYFAQDRQGSTDEAKLFLQKEGWWWASPMNPDYEPEKEDNTARIFGKALHALILEGDQAYADRFAITPTQDEVRARNPPNAQGQNTFANTSGEIELALEQRGLNPKRMKKDELIAYAATRAPDVVIWEVFQQKWAKEHAGRAPVSGAEDRQLKVMTEAVREHPDVGPLFKFGADNVPMSEVSVLYTDQYGIRRRSRFDNLLPQTIIDVKTLANIGMRPLAFSAGDHIAKMGYHVQMASHHHARRRLYRMVAEGMKNVSGGSELERAWLAKYPAQAPNWDYAWLLYQKPSAQKGVAPIVLPWGEDYGSQLHMDGVRARHEAIQTYLRCVAQFGPDEPWTRVEPLHTSQEVAGMPRVFLPAYIAMPEYPGEDEDL